MMFGIAYKPDPARPATLGGRVLARSETFDTREEGERFLAFHKQDGWMQIVETDGTITAAFPEKP